MSEPDPSHEGSGSETKVSVGSHVGKPLVTPTMRRGESGQILIWLFVMHNQQ